MSDVHQRSNMDCSLLFLYFQNDLPPALYLLKRATLATFRASPIIHRCFCIRDFHRSVHKNELVHKITMTQRVEPLPFGRVLSERFLVDL